MQLILNRVDLNSLIDVLNKHDYQIIGPTLRDGAIIYDEIESTEDLPAGWTDAQEPGHYRVEKREDKALFGYVVGPHSWKKYLYPANEELWTAKRSKQGVAVQETDHSTTRYAFLGVRSCELHAMAIQDKVFLGDVYRDERYEQRRKDSFIVAVNCSEARSTCFCTSMQSGPRADAGYDIVLTEILENAEHYFVIESGSEKGDLVLEELPLREATEEDLKREEAAYERACSQMERQLETADLKELLYRNYENPHWEDVASRCIACTNCTMVCPTCFCTTVEDVSDLKGEESKRVRKWDSCFTMDFSYVHGGNIRASTASRYRQWLTHKFATWIDQFGTSGCVGCGRCITWCPVGIDITQELKAIREIDQSPE